MIRRFILLCCLLVAVDAWAPNQKPFVKRAIKESSHKLTSAVPTSTARKMLKNTSFKTSNRKASLLSNSVLASCDTLPSFQTAHGLLSPETVMRLESTHPSNMAVRRFLKLYKSSGPLSCVSMLSDPEILPHLTTAMREMAL